MPTRSFINHCWLFFFSRQFDFRLFLFLRVGFFHVFSFGRHCKMIQSNKSNEKKTRKQEESRQLLNFTQQPVSSKTEKQENSTSMSSKVRSCSVLLFWIAFCLCFSVEIRCCCFLHESGQYCSKNEYLIAVLCFLQSSPLLLQPQANKRVSIRPELTLEQKEEIREAFDLFDTNGSGKR